MDSADGLGKSVLAGELLAVLNIGRAQNLAIDLGIHNSSAILRLRSCQISQWFKD